MDESRRIVKNTGVLYLKMLLTIFINLYSTRLILSSLGIEDFGLFSVIGGVIGMLSFLSTSMATSTQRFLSISIGENNLKEIKSVFSNSVLLHITIGVLVVLFFEFVGIYLIENRLEINPSKIDIAKKLMHFVIVTSFISIISVPYDSVIDARENMVFVFWVGLLESLLKFLIALSLTFMESDQLLMYGLLIMLSSIVIRIIKQIYTVGKYEECKNLIFRGVDYVLMKDMLYFALWNTLGILTYMARNQGVLVLLGMFFSTVIVGAFGIANQVVNQTAFFSETMMKTLRPQIIKSEGIGNRNRMLDLSIQASKFSFILMSLFLIPVYFTLDWILDIWLKEVPAYTSVFCKLMIVLMLIRQLSSGIIVSAHALNKIKSYQVLVSPIQLSALVIAYIFFSFGYSAEYVVYIALLIEGISLFVKIYFLKKYTGLTKTTYLKKVVISSLNSFILTFIIIWLAVEYLLKFSQFFNSIIVFLLSFLIYPIFVYIFSISSIEKVRLSQIINSFKIKNIG